MRHLGELRPLLGVMAKDLPRYLRALTAPGEAYASLCNRNERLERSPDGHGYRCLWQWTSDLHAPKHLPMLGAALMRRALRDHPIRAAAAPFDVQQPRISFIVGHRGLDRLGHLLATLETIAGQREAAVECVVVEQDTQPLVRERLPAWVRYVHTPPPRPDLAYCRSWAFNVGVRHARADVLVLHDNDMLVPQDYAMQVLHQLARGFEVVNLKRFVFYLTQAHTERYFRGEASLTAQAPLAVMQNAEGGGSLAITRAAYDGIGGFDEAFVGWGGEDVEFWERAGSRRVWPYAFLPLVHLWHGPQPDKMARQNETLALYRSRTQTPVDQRIAALRALPCGDITGPRV